MKVRIQINISLLTLLLARLLVINLVLGYSYVIYSPTFLFPKWDYPHFTDKTTEAQRSEKVARLRIEPPNMSFSHTSGELRW